MSSEGESVTTRQDAASSSYKPPPVHVPPRIDPDLYQAEIPDFKPDAEAERIALVQSARCVYSENRADSEAVDEFLVLVRNLMDKMKPCGSSVLEHELLAASNGTNGTVNESSTKGNDSATSGELSAQHGTGIALWQKHHSSFPLQSDAAALEYLSSFDYDVEKAWFHLCCMLGCGKDAVLTRKTLTSVERQANATVFQDNKDRFFNKNLSATTYSLVGAYGKHSGKGITGQCSINVDHHPQEPREEDMQMCTQLLHRSGAAGAAAPAALSTKSSRSNFETLTVKSEGGRSVEGGSGGLFSQEELDSIDAVGVALAGAGASSAALSAAAASGSRAARNTNSNLDKAELKKQWLSLTKKVSAALAGSSKKSSSSNSSGANGSAASSSSSSGRCNIREAHRLLDKAAQLTPYSTVSMSSHNATPEEEEILNSSKLVLGELLKAVLTTRDWIAEVRDTLYNCNLNLIIRVDRESRQVTNVTELKTLLTEGCNLQIVSPTEETQLRDLIATVEGISKDMRRIILVHLAAAHRHQPTATGATTTSEGVERWGLGAGREPERPPPLYVSAEERRKYHYDLSLAGNHLRNALDYGSAGTVNAAFSNGTSGGTSEGLAEGKIITLGELSALMGRIRQLPIVINETIYLQHILDQALDFAHVMQAFLAKTRMLKFTKTKTILEHTKPDLATMLNLRDTIEHLCVVQIPEYAEFVSALNVALNWQKEVWGLNNEVPPPLSLWYQSASSDAATAAAATVTTVGTSARAKAKAGSAAAAAHSKPVPLKKVEYLLTEGEKLPFTFPPEMEILKEKKQQAKLWLEKLKKSFVPSKAGSNRLRKGQEEGDEGTAAGGAGAGGPEKLKLSDMKMMVSEGEQLFNLESGEGSTGRSTVNRELDRALNVVETAEDWVSRVRELLLSDYSEAKSTDNDDEDAEKDEEEGGEDSDDASDAGKPPTVAAMIRFLHNLLHEADQMPVVMEEATVLRAHLQALEWSVKVKPYLPVVTPITTTTTDTAPADAEAQAMEGVTTTGTVDQDDEGQQQKKAARSSRPSASSAAAATAAGSVLARRKNPRPRLAEMQTFAREITKIRGSLSEALRAEFPTRPLVEETQCLELVAEAERWLGRVKRVLLQGNTIKKGTPLAKLRALFSEGQEIPINFHNELKPIRAAIAAAEDWLDDHHPLLTRLGLWQEESRERTIPREGKEASAAAAAEREGPEEEEEDEEAEEKGGVPMDTENAASATAAAAHAEAVNDDDQADAESTGAVTLKDLVDLVHSASGLIAEFPSALAVAEKLEEVTSWLTSVKGIASKSNGGSSSRESQRKKKKTAAAAYDESDDVSAAATSGVAAAAAASESAAAATPGKPVKLVTLAEVDALIDDGLSFGLDLSEEVASLQQVKASALSWQRRTEEYFAEEFVRDITTISKQTLQLHAQVQSKPGVASLGFTFLLLLEKLSANGDKKVSIGSGGAAAASTGSPLNDREIHETLLAVLTSLSSLEAEGAMIGIDLPVTAVLRLYTSILNWIVDARSLLCANTVTSVNSYADSTRNPQASSANPFATKLPHWGDCTAAYVSTLLEEADRILSALSGDSDNNAADGAGDVKWDQTVLTDDMLKTQRGFNEKLNDFYADKFEDKKAAAAAEDEGAAEAPATESSGMDSAAVAAATTSSSSGGAGGKRGGGRGGSSGGNSRKRDRHAAELEQQQQQAATAAAGDAGDEAVSDSEAAAAGGAAAGSRRSKEVKVEAKATRGSQGIVKKKLDTAYDDKAPATGVASPTAAVSAAVHASEQAEAPTVSTAAAKETSSSRSKKRKLDADSGVSNAIESESSSTSTSSAVYVRSTEYQKHLDAVVQQQNGDTSLLRSLPSPLLTLLQVWRRALTLFSLRLVEVHRWHAEIASLVKSHTNAAGVVTRYYGEQAQQYVAIASERQLHCSSRAEMEERIQGSKTWLATASVLASNSAGGAKMTMDDLKAFVKLSDSVIFPHDEVLDDLKNALKAARNWKIKFDRSGYDPNTGAGASSEIVTELIAESKTIGVDLSEFTENLNQFTKTYCLCRQLYFGEMVGCDTCEEWYHFSCIGVNSNIANRNDSYVCIRCALANSFNYSCEMVAQMTNKWMLNSEHFKVREGQLQRTEKKIQRDENLFARLQNNLRIALVDTTRHVARQAAEAEAAAATAAAVTGVEPSALAGADDKQDPPVATAPPPTTTAAAPVTAVTVPVIENNRASMMAAFEPLPQNFKLPLTALWRELDEVEAGLVKARSDYSTLKAVMKEEASKLQYIIQWMMMLKKILWPQTDLQKSVGAPLGSDQAATAALAKAYEDAKLACAGEGGAAATAAAAEKGETVVKAAESSSSSTTSEEDKMDVEEGGAEIKTEVKVPAMVPTPAAAAAAPKDPVEALSERRAYLVRCLSNNLLPDGLITMAHSAIAMGIHNIEDVLLAVDAFRWMSWCNICLQLLRSPPSTYEIRKLVDATRNLRLTDEKSIKLLTTIQTKATQWKSKARKLILQSMKGKLDEAKLTQCVLEGNSLPFSSRLKDILKGMMPKKPEAAAASSAGAGGELSGTRKSVKPLTSSLGGRSSAVPREVPDSSDEERTFNTRLTAAVAASSSAAAAPPAPFKQGCTFDPTTLAEETVIKWPVQLSTAQKSLNMEMTAQMIRTHGGSAAKAALLNFNAECASPTGAAAAAVAAAAVAAGGGGSGSSAAKDDKSDAAADEEEQEEAEQEEEAEEAK